MIKRALGTSSLFTGGDEPTPLVKVVKGIGRGGMGADHRIFSIKQNGAEVLLSAETMHHILNWAQDG